jgi:hypothetical protein
MLTFLLRKQIYCYAFCILWIFKVSKIKIGTWKLARRAVRFVVADEAYVTVEKIFHSMIIPFLNASKY